MTTTDKNRFVAEKLGMCWHEDMPHELKPDGAMLCRKCGKMFPGDHVINPDFSTDQGAVQLLRLMKERENWEGFKFEIASRHIKGSLHSGINNVVNCIITPGALLNAVWEFFGGKDE